MESRTARNGDGAAAAGRDASAARASAVAPSIHRIVVVVAVAVALPFALSDFRAVPVHPGPDLRDRAARPEHAHRLQRPDLARPRRVLRDRRLHDRDHDRPVEHRRMAGPSPSPAFVCLVVGFLFGRPGPAAGGALPGAGDLRARPGRAADLEVLRALDGRVPGHRAAQAQGPLRPPPQPRTSGSTSSPWPSPSSCSSLAWNLLRGRVGRAIVAIRDNHIAAEAMGVDSALYKSHRLRRQRGLHRHRRRAVRASPSPFVAPDSFNVFLSITFLTGHRDRRARDHLRGDLRRAVHPVRAELGPGHLEGRPVGHLRRLPDRASCT